MNDRISDLLLTTTPVGFGYNNMDMFRNSLGGFQTQLAVQPLGLDGSIFLKGEITHDAGEVRMIRKHKLIKIERL
jgi:tRNA(Ser,Leu) C12 N-acetylase TAN1